jgi:hypothetical protein
MPTSPRLKLPVVVGNSIVSSCEVSMMRTLLVIGGLAVVTTLSACGPSHSDFPIVVANRTGGTITVFVNGNSFGDVAGGQISSFDIEVQDSAFITRDVRGNPTAASPVSRVTFSAKDQGTGALSSGKEATLTQHAPTYVEFGPADF